MDYILHILIMMCIYAILCMSANMLTGLTNLISLGYAAFYGIGAYVTALCVLYLHMSLVPTLIVILFINILFALLIALPSLRLKGDYFILATLGFQMIIFTVLYNWTDVTRGPYGISGITEPVVINSVKLDSTYSFLVFGIVLCLILGFLMYIMIKSPFSRVLRALRDDEIALISLGRNVNYFKILAFIISSAFTGLAGYLYATYISYIDPTSFTLDESIFILSALLIGGTGNIKGPLVGAMFVVILPEVLRFVGLPDSIAAPLRQILYGAILIWIMFNRKQGIAGKSVIAE